MCVTFEIMPAFIVLDSDIIKFFLLVSKALIH